MASKIVLITGANTGLGFETVKALMRSNVAYTIVMGVRSLAKGGEAIRNAMNEIPHSKSALGLLEVDLESDESISKAFAQFSSQYDRIDTLVNNGGAAFDREFPHNMTLRETYNKAYNINVAGTEVMTTIFMPLLLKSSEPRLLFLTSGYSSLSNSADRWLVFGVPESGPIYEAGWPKPARPPTIFGYRSSKAALNMTALGWHWMLERDGVKVFVVSPGFYATGLGGNPENMKKLGAGDPAEGAKVIAAVVQGERDADAGKVVTGEGTQPW